MRLLLSLLLLVVADASAQTPPSSPTERPVTLDGTGDVRPDRPRNVVLMIADGFGPASATLGAAAKGAPLAFDSLLVGSVETSATDSRVTDSAASATAYACGIKTVNGAISVDTTGAPCRTVLEAAEARGMATGLVATSRITHATPAAFAAHVASRASEAEIARQLPASGVDVLFGGGRTYFADRSGDARPTDTLVADMMVADGWTVATDRAGYDAIRTTPAAAILADSHLAYEIDRDETDQPSLAEMATRALDLLAASPDGRERGFFLMVEGSRIDHAGHANDPAAHLGDVLAYDRAVAAVLAWAARDGHTLVVSTADHETGGMTLGRDGIYAWDPAPLLAATASLERLAERVRDGEGALAVVTDGLGHDVNAEVAEAIEGGRALTPPRWRCSCATWSRSRPASPGPRAATPPLTWGSTPSDPAPGCSTGGWRTTPSAARCSTRWVSTAKRRRCPFTSCRGQPGATDRRSASGPGVGGRYPGHGPSSLPLPLSLPISARRHGARLRGHAPRLARRRWPGGRGRRGGHLDP